MLAIVCLLGVGMTRAQADETADPQVGEELRADLERYLARVAEWGSE